MKPEKKGAMQKKRSLQKGQTIWVGIDRVGIDCVKLGENSLTASGKCYINIVLKKFKVFVKELSLNTHFQNEQKSLVSIDFMS